MKSIVKGNFPNLAWQCVNFPEILEIPGGLDNDRYRNKLHRKYINYSRSDS